MSWHVDSWREKPNPQAIAYDDEGELEQAVARLRELPPLVNSWEVERLKGLLAEAEAGRRFVLQGGDCAETLKDCKPQVIANKLKILLQMSLVLIHGSQRPIVRIGRLAGQYAKPRSQAYETREGRTLPSYFGDLVNDVAFTPEARRPNPRALLDAYAHASMTLNFIRSLGESGFADVHHPEYWDLGFFARADLPVELAEGYRRTTSSLGEALRFMEALGEGSVHELTRAEFYTSHEALSLHYESAQTRTVPRREGHYVLTTHMPWIGERTRSLTGAHVEFFRGVRNPVGVKLGPGADPDEVAEIFEALDPANEPGKLMAITRLGVDHVERVLPRLVEATKRRGRRVLWVSDPMHGNTVSTASGQKTRHVEDVFREIDRSFDVHAAVGSRLGGVHFELTGEDVTECVGGGLAEADLDRNYASLCDPRLNYRQALEMAFRVARRLG